MVLLFAVSLNSVSSLFLPDRLSGLGCLQRWSSSLPQKTDASTETDSELILGHHQTQLAGEERAPRPPHDHQGLSSNSSQSESDDDDSDSELSENSVITNRREPFQDQSQRGGQVRRGGRDSVQTVGQSCCRVCGKVFRYKRSFLKHLLLHEQSSELCGACGKKLDAGESLKAHLQMHSEENIGRDGDVAGRPEAGCVEAAGRDEDGDEDWKESGVSDDGERDETRGSDRHRAAESKDTSHLKYRCKVCAKTFCYRASFLKHVQEDERETDVCGVCGKHFESEKGLRLHLQTYIRTNDCEVCGKHFDGHKQLEMHMRTHTGEKPYICTVCGKAFAQNGNLMGHMRVHTGERPYICSVCGQSFGFKEYMMAHMRIHTGEKPFLCSVCGKGFRQRGTLKTHMMIHTGESTHRCSVCDKTFYKSGALKIHMRSHTGEKPYLCNVCGKSFTASGSLTKHMGVHQGERTHRCSACGKGFLKEEDLRRHAETHQDGSTLLTSL